MEISSSSHVSVACVVVSSDVPGDLLAGGVAIVRDRGTDVATLAALGALVMAAVSESVKN